MSTTEETREGFYLNEDGELVPDGWKNSPLNQVVSDFIDYRGKTPKKTNSGIPLITAKVVKDGRVFQTEEYIAESEYDSWMRRGIPEEGDVILTTEAPLGEVAFIPKGKIALAQRIITLRGKADELDNSFLKYSLQSPLMQYRLTARESGSTVSGIKSSELKVTDILHPENFNEQKAIAAILSSLDDKIELLREQNETLEALAQTLFKRWFIDFNFPDENGNPYKDSGGKMTASEFGEIPEGWSVKRLKDFGKIICGKTPSKGNSNYFGQDIPFIKIPDMHGNLFILNTGEYLSTSGANSQSNKMIPSGSIMVSCIATVGVVALTSCEAQTNQQINSIVPNSSKLTEYLFLRLKTLYSFLQNLGAGGSATLNINTTSFSEIEIICPDDLALRNFHNVTSIIFSKIKTNSHQIQTLTHLRDTLLPKLMKGEIRVPAD